MLLLEALANAPVCVVSKRWPRRLHAADGSAITAAATGATITAACGAQRLRLLVHDGHPVLFPPPKLAAGIPRCEDCWAAAGRPHPRTGRQLTGRRDR